MKDFKDAMKQQDQERLSTLKMLKSAIRNEEIEQGEELTDDQIRSILAKKAKNHEESIEQYEEGGRDDLVEKERRELEIVEQYLPDPLTEEELKTMVDDAIDETKARDMSDMGDVMDWIMPKVRGRADGSKVNDLVRNKLS